ncbi:uncharacterized protein B0H18DRAFT_95230 [Fomitopsis serialis]|uniref:uncharacterized protein n=1 Tax=Fomitopsis serialis TaxID=139415 RepID=UPI0020083C74|nr:uncharacterized protein B0H18DRAFT_95230 [Neoantrodia serialis]KAH9915539.1 hypothetical protein B0H18DRAFT_95230 [Neoantrodia serialis]
MLMLRISISMLLPVSPVALRVRLSLGVHRRPVPSTSKQLEFSGGNSRWAMLATLSCRTFISALSSGLSRTPGEDSEDQSLILAVALPINMSQGPSPRRNGRASSTMLSSSRSDSTVWRVVRRALPITSGSYVVVSHATPDVLRAAQNAGYPTKRLRTRSERVAQHDVRRMVLPRVGMS